MNFFFICTIVLTINYEINGFKDFQWYNKPQSFVVSKDFQKLEVLSTPLSDYWVKTWYNFTRDSGNFFYTEIDSENIANTTIDLVFIGHYKELYDQAGIMIRLDKNNWMKTGIEFVEKPHTSVVITNSFSDWSVIALEEGKFSIDSPFYVSVFIDEINSFEVKYSLDGKNYNLMRIGRLKFDEHKKVKIGVMTASPTNKNGFKTNYESFKISNEKKICKTP